ncbi:MAG: protein translocase subunit SecF [Terriglobales bacterium]
MELFKDTNIDFLGKKWYFLTLTMVLFVAGMVSLALHHGPDMGIDFTGGTVVDVKFSHAAPIDQLRHGLDAAGLKETTLQPVGGKNSDEVLISLPLAALNEAELEHSRDEILATLYQTLGEKSEKIDINNVSPQGLTQWLLQKDPNHWVVLGEQEAEARYHALAETILHQYRDTTWKGLVPSFAALGQIPGVTPQLVSLLPQDFFISSFNIRSAQIIGAQVGSQLRGQAIRAILYALVGMLVYIAFRFEWIYGLAAVVAVFHDVLITLGMFSIAKLPITLTVIAAFLTLIGYSMNDTIVVFDRVRENLKILRREKLPDLVNLSINQTLSRTILTSGLTFLSVLSLLVLGGDVLRGFSFCMTFGILVGTYSSIAVAAPMMVAYIEWRNQRQRPLRAAAGARAAEKSEKVVRSRG